MGAHKNANMAVTEDTVKIVADINESDLATTDEPSSDQPTKKSKKATGPARSKKYQTVRSKVDKTRTYDPFSAIELVKRLAYGKFNGSIEAHVMVKEVGDSVAITFPHSTGKTVRVAIADEALLSEIEAGTINFDILVAAPAYMPKLAKLAKVLGPRGLMPNPKNGTLTDKTAEKKKQLESGQITLKTEKKAPLMHLVIGKQTMETKELVENLQTLLTALKGKAVRLTICSSMSPGVKVQVE